MYSNWGRMKCSACGSPPEAMHLDSCPNLAAMQPLPYKQKRCEVCLKPSDTWPMCFLDEDTCSIDCRKKAEGEYVA